MQSVSGFVPDSTYTIRFFQAVDASYGCVDTSGSWAVYVGSTLIGTTDPTSSTVPYASWPFAWEERTVSFTAWSTAHTIKFLPVDDDLELDVLNPNGALRMAIDLISILQGHHQVGMADEEEATMDAVFPNPFVDQLTIRTPLAFVKGRVFVHAVTGELLREVALVSTERQPTIDLAELRPGPYVVRVVLDGRTYRRVVLKE